MIFSPDSFFVNRLVWAPQAFLLSYTRLFISKKAHGQSPRLFVLICTGSRVSGGPFFQNVRVLPSKCCAHLRPWQVTCHTLRLYMRGASGVQTIAFSNHACFTVGITKTACFPDKEYGQRKAATRALKPSVWEVVPPTGAIRSISVGVCLRTLFVDSFILNHLVWAPRV